MAAATTLKETQDDILANRLDALLALVACIWVESADNDTEKDRRKVVLARLFNRVGVPGELAANALSVTKGSYYNLVMRAKTRSARSKR